MSDKQGALRVCMQGLIRFPNPPTLSPLSLPPTPFVFDPACLYARLLTLTDHRDPRDLRYPLAALLTLAKLAGQNQIRDIA